MAGMDSTEITRIGRRHFLRLAGAMAFCIRPGPFPPLARSPAPGATFNGAEPSVFPVDRIGVGLEFGTSCMYAAVVELPSNGSRKLLVADETPLRGYSNGRIVDFDVAQRSIHQALVKAEVWSDVMIQGANIAMPELDYEDSQWKEIARCVREIPLEIKVLHNYPLAIAEVALSQPQKDRGALLFDVRAGTTDCVLYLDGAVWTAVSVDVGWHHMSDYVAHGRSIAPVSSENLDVEEASAILSGEVSRKEALREMIERRAQMRMRAAFQLLKHDIEVPGGGLRRLGAGIFVAECSGLLRGIDELAGHIFGLPVNTARIQGMTGPSEVLDDPKYTRAIGLASMPEPTTGAPYGWD
jgi:cell division ATPase FtsA